MYQNTHLQTIVQSHSNKNSMVLAQNRYEDQWNRTEDPDMNRRLRLDFLQKHQKHTMEKR
jgi:hypothetical protein